MTLFDPPATVQRLHDWQEDQLRRTTRALGYDPKALPPDDPQREFHVKSLIRTRCGKKEPVKMRAVIFNQTWERMMTRIPPALMFRP